MTAETISPTENVKASDQPIVTRRTERAKRVAIVNDFIRVMADNGRRFFYHESSGRYAELQMDERGRIWFIDEHSGDRIYTHYRYRWRGFSGGGTMRELVCGFRDFVMTGKKLASRAFGPWPDWYCGGDLWGYGKDATEIVRNKAKECGLISSASVIPFAESQ